MKKFLSLLLALVLCLALLPSTALAANELPTPTDLVWGVRRWTYYGTGESGSEAVPGCISWFAADGEKFLVCIYNVDDPTTAILTETLSVSPQPNSYYSTSLFIEGPDSGDAMDSGTYFFTVQAIKKDGVSSDKATSAPWTYLKPSAQLKAPGKPVWEWPMFHWAASGQGVYAYDMQITFSAHGETPQLISGGQTKFTDTIFGQSDPSPGSYRVRVRALSNDTTKIRNSDWSTYSDPYVLEDGASTSIQLDYGVDYERVEHLLLSPESTFFDRLDINERLRKAWSEADPSKCIVIQSDRVIELSNEICDGITSDYDKAKAIYIWMANNVAYDYDYEYGSKKTCAEIPEDVIDSKLAVCNGYSRLTLALLQAQNIPALYVEGYANGRPHAWNLAYVNGHWIYIDSTWARQPSMGINGESPVSPDWFDPTPEFVAQSRFSWTSSYDPYGFGFDMTPYPPSSSAATPNRSTVLVNGQAVAFDAYTINQNNYFKLRDLAKVLSGTGKRFEVTWDGANNAINMVSGKPYTAVGGELAQGDGTDKTASLNTAIIYLDGTPVQLTAYTINQNNYFKLRDVGQTFDFDVTWDGAQNTIVIDTTHSYTAD